MTVKEFAGLPDHVLRATHTRDLSCQLSWPVARNRIRAYRAKLFPNHRQSDEPPFPVFFSIIPSSIIHNYGYNY